MHGIKELPFLLPDSFILEPVLLTTVLGCSYRIPPVQPNFIYKFKKFPHGIRVFQLPWWLRW